MQLTVNYFSLIIPGHDKVFQTILALDPYLKYLNISVIVPVIQLNFSLNMLLNKKIATKKLLKNKQTNENKTNKKNNHRFCKIEIYT